MLKPLSGNEPELKVAGPVDLRPHGSVARGQQTSSSDVDLIAEFDSGRRFSLIDRAHLQGRWEDLLGAPVDLSAAGTLREPVRERAGREAFGVSEQSRLAVSLPRDRR